MNKLRHVLAVGAAVIFWSCDEPFIPVPQPSIYLAKFPDDKSAAVSFTFDDNCPSSFSKISPLFEEYGFRCSFFIIPGNIRDSTEWTKWKALSEKGFEIGNHSMSHLDLTKLDSISLTEQVNAAFESIKGHISKAPLSFAPPENRTNDFVNSIISQKHPFNRADAKNAYVCQAWGPATKPADALDHVKQCIATNGWYIVAAHGIDDGWQPINESVLENTLEYCKANEASVIVETFENLKLYTLEQRNTRISIQKGHDQQTITLESDLPTNIYQFPLTLVLDNHQFPSPYKVYDRSTGEVLQPKEAPGNKLLIRVRLHHSYEIRWRDR